jgi:hypothetical protein
MTRRRPPREHPARSTFNAQYDKAPHLGAGANGVPNGIVRGPFFNGPNQFAVTFDFDVTQKDTGRRITLEEVGVYTVKGDKITREQFFYDGGH